MNFGVRIIDGNALKPKELFDVSPAFVNALHTAW